MTKRKAPHGILFTATVLFGAQCRALKISVICAPSQSPRIHFPGPMTSLTTHSRLLGRSGYSNRTSYVAETLSVVPVVRAGSKFLRGGRYGYEHTCGATTSALERFVVQTSAREAILSVSDFEAGSRHVQAIRVSLSLPQQAIEDRKSSKREARSAILRSCEEREVL